MSRSAKYGSGDFGFSRVSDDDKAEEEEAEQDERSHLLADLAKKKESAAPPKPVDDNGALAAGSMCTCCCCCMIVLLIVGGLLVRYDDLRGQDPATVAGAVLLALGLGAFLCVCMTCFMACFLSSVSNLNSSSGGAPDEIKLELKRLNDKYEKEESKLESLRLDVTAGVKAVKEAKKKESKRKKERLKQRKEEIERQVKLDLESGLSVPQVQKKSRPCAFRIDFEGDLQVSSIDTLREQISCIIKIGAPKYDKVVVLVTSPGGSVTMYGLAAAQLIRLKKAGFKLTVCVDSIAASGGYLMSSVADEICCAPMALIGSIGVISIVPNVHDLLEKHNVHTHVFTAGKYKNTVNVVGEISEEGKKKFKQEMEEIHTVFKDLIALHRPALQAHIEELATGEAFLGVQAKQKGLVDHILTSDEYLEQLCPDYDIILVKQKPKKSFFPEVFENMYNPESLSFKNVFQQFLGQPALL